jgi:hypothetical protein
VVIVIFELFLHVVDNFTDFIQILSSLFDQVLNIVGHLVRVIGDLAGDIIRD